MLLWSIVLLVALVVFMSLLIYEVYENSKQVLRPSLGSVIGAYSNMIDLFQALLLEQINDSITTLEDYLEM